jgi:hypothetical protein
VPLALQGGVCKVPEVVRWQVVGGSRCQWQSQVLRLSVRAEWGFSVGSGSGAVRPTGVESTLRWLSGGATVPEVDPERELLGVESTECADRRTGPTPRGLK